MQLYGDQHTGRFALTELTPEEIATIATSLDQAAQVHPTLRCLTRMSQAFRVLLFHAGLVRTEVAPELPAPEPESESESEAMTGISVLV